LHRVVDAIALESDAGRRFAEAVDKYLASSCRDEGASAELRGDLTRWRDNDVNLEALAQRSFLVKEVVPVSQDLATAATVGLAAMDYLILGAQAADAWKSQQLALLAELNKPKAQLLLTPLAGVQKLVEASTGGACASSK
jgi:hexosaminidase